jgi:hypothetical protein
MQVFLLMVFPIQAWAGLLEHGSALEKDESENQYYIFHADQALKGGDRVYGFLGKFPAPVFDRFRVRQDRLIGRPRRRTLTVDESSRRLVPAMAEPRA